MLFLRPRVFLFWRKEEGWSASSWYVQSAELSCSIISDSATTCTVSRQAPRPWRFSRQEYWSGVPCLAPGDLPNPGMEPKSPALQVDSLPSEPWGKPKNTGGGSLSLSQGIFPTQESNRGLLHCRQTLYQLSYQGSWHRPISQALEKTWLTGNQVLPPSPHSVK